MTDSTSADGSADFNNLHFSDHNYAIDTSGQSNVAVENPCITVDSINTNKDDWQTVPKRRSFDPLSITGQKKSKHESSASSNIKLQNSFSVLNHVNNGMESDAPIAQPSEPKPPPIFIPDVGNVQAMIRTFESVVNSEDFNYKCINNNSVKILPNSADIYRKLVHKLNEGNVSFHTYQLKQDRAYRVVLKNMHYSVDTTELKEALSQLGHHVRNITNVIQASTKKPLSMFFIDLEPRPNNKDIFNVQYLLHARITFEPPHKKRDIVQCKRCQQYGHTKSYCRHPFRCVKCGKDHDTAKCNKDSSTPAVCALCGGGHPANYKGCTVYKNIQNRTNPPLRKRTESLQEPAATRPHTPPYRPTQPNLSYAEATRNVTVNKCDATKSKSATNDCSNQDSPCVETKHDQLTQTINSFFDRFEKLFLQQSKQIGSLLDLLTTVLKKIN